MSFFHFCLAVSGVLSRPPCAQHTGRYTPEMRVIHAGLVIGDSDERGGWASVLDELIQHLLVVDGKVVHVLCGERKSVGVLATSSSGAQDFPQPSPLTGPEAAVGAHQAHDDAAGQGPGEPRHGGEWPFNM